MKEERDDITLKARDIELHIESAEYQLEDNKKVNDMLTKAANASEKLMIDIEKHSDATRKQIIETDESFTQTLKMKSVNLQPCQCQLP
jgi:ferritin-like metal-binding protein YciE